MKKVVPFVLLSVLLGAAGAQNKPVIKIATQSPLSGEQSSLGVAIKNGAELAMRDYGKMLADLGFQPILTPYDDQAKPATGVANANRLINDADVLAVVGHLNSGVALPSMEVYNKVTLAMVSPANTNPAITDRNYSGITRIVGRDDVQGAAASQYAIQDLKAKSAIVINDKTAYGQGLADVFAKEFAKAGGKVIENNGIDSSTTDFSPIVNRVVALKPDMVYFGGIYSQGGLFIKQLREKGYTNTFMGGDGLDSSDLEKLAGQKNLNNVIYTTTALPLNQVADGKKFIDSYKRAFNKDPESYGMYGYDAMRIAIQGIADAIKANKGQKPSRAQVSAAIRKVSFKGLTGEIAFNSKGDLKMANYVVIKIGTDGYRNAKVVKSIKVDAPTK